MKRYYSVAMMLALTVGLTVTASAAAVKKAPLSGTVGLGYIMGSETVNTTGGNVKADQNFFPMVTGSVTLMPQIAVFGEYSTAPSKASKDIATMSLKSNKMLIGGKYLFAGTPYNASLSYESRKITVADSTGANGGDVKISGFRLGVGASQAFKGLPVVASVDFGIGLAQKAKITGGSSPKSNLFDADLKVGYKVPKYSVVPFLGYRYSKDSIKANTSGVNDVKVSGFMIGADYNF